MRNTYLKATFAVTLLFASLSCGAQTSPAPEEARTFALAAGASSAASAVAPNGSSGAVSAFMKEKLCSLCHTEEPLSKASAPSFAAVARKYKGNPDALAVVTRNIARGSSQQWGNQYMTAYDPVGNKQVLITAVAKFVLSQGR
jgi:cytochrome c551/c552